MAPPSRGGGSARRVELKRKGEGPEGLQRQAVGGNEVWSHCPEKAMLPPLKGWKIPFQAPPKNSFLMMPRPS